MKAKSKIFTDELKRTFPIYILGMIFHACEIYILYKISPVKQEYFALFYT